MASSEKTTCNTHDKGMAALGVAIGFVASTLVNAFLAITVVPQLVQDRMVDTEIARMGGLSNYVSWAQFQQETLKEHVANKNLQGSINKFSSENTVPTEVKVKRAQNSLLDGAETKTNVRDALNTQLKGRKLLSDEQQTEILKKRELAKIFLDNTKEYDIFQLPSDQMTLPTE